MNATSRSELADRIIRTIHLKERHRVLRRVVSFAVLSIASFGGLVSSVIYSAKEIASSGFIEYVSLFVTSDATIFRYSHDVFLTLVESAPFVGFMACLAALIVLGWASEKTIRSIRRIPNFA